MSVMTIGRRGALGLPLAALAVTRVESAMSRTPAPADAQPEEALGIGLEGLPYPGPIAFHTVLMGGQKLRMAYMDFAPAGPANGRAIFLFHGKNFDSSYWTEVIGWLRGAGYRVIVPDQIGFNKSAKPTLDYSFEMLAKNTMSLADALALAQIEILGHSTGGALAVRLASLFPKRVTRLVLEDPIGLVDYRDYIPPQDTETLVAAEYAYTADSYRAFIGRFFPLLPGQDYERFVSWRMRVARSAEFDRFARAAALTYQMIYHGPTRPLYAGLAMPVLLMAGTNDRSAPLIGYASPEAKARIKGIHEAAQDAMKELRAGVFASFPGVGHVPHLEAPERFREQLLSFLKS